MTNYVSVIFCRNCGSRVVEISEWTEQGAAVLHCRSCNAKEESAKFTLGRGKISNTELQNARDTRARKGVLDTDKYER